MVVMTRAFSAGGLLDPKYSLGRCPRLVSAERPWRYTKQRVNDTEILSCPALHFVAQRS